MNVFEAAAAAWRTGRPAALATVIRAGGSTPRHSEARMLVYADGTTVGTIGGGALEHQVIAAALEALAERRPRRVEAHLTRDLGMCCGGEMEVYIEPLRTRSPLFLIGAGHVAHALAPILTALEFSVTVVDERDDLATAERFPDCELAVVDPRGWAADPPSGPDCYYVVVTHDHKLDQDVVEALLPRRCAYLGLIGSRAKIAKFLIRYRAAGLDEALFAKLSAPIGLDIGAETPAEIAVAIAAELVRVRRGSVVEPRSLGEIPLPARGGDGVARPPGLTSE